MVNFKRFSQLLSPENQLYEINSMINQLINLITKVKILKKNLHIKWTKDNKKGNND